MMKPQTAPFIKKGSLEDNWFKRLPKIYREEIGNLPLLEKEEEVNLMRLSGECDIEARQKLVKHNLRFVLVRANDFQHYLGHDRSITFYDLFQWGALGLTKAARGCRPRKGSRFLSYAVWHIDAAILDAIMFHRLIRIKHTGQKLIKRYNEVERFIMEYEETDYALIDDVAWEMDVNQGLATEINLWRELRKVDRLQDLSSEEEEAVEYHVADNEYDTVECTVQQRLLPELILERLRKRFRHWPRAIEVLERYYGLGEQEEMDMEKIAKDTDLTQERVRQIRDEALRRLYHDPILREAFMEDPYLDPNISDRFDFHMRSIFRWRPS